ncbi:MAG TPA: CAP domain-containing protein [Pseudonocardiaceae bacterium]|nr:CAP domain-containing protein [Pseudonocardiaceae bacterium]
MVVGAVVAACVTMAGRLGTETAPVADVVTVRPPNMVAVTGVVTTGGVAGRLTSVVAMPLTTVVVSTTTTTVATTTSAPPPSPVQVVFALVNQARAQAGCKALIDDPRLDAAAQQHSDDMSSRDYFSHTTPEGVTFDKRELAAGYPGPGGENIAQGQTSAQQVMTAWMNSSGHRANILNCSFVAIGVGLNTNRWYWTQDFGR